jgi:hypothetical protein
LYGDTPNFTNLRQIVAGTINHRKEKMSNKPQATSHKHQASSDKRLSKKAMKIHEAWCIENGYLKPQATSVKLPGSRYKSSDYSSVRQIVAVMI